MAVFIKEDSAKKLSKEVELPQKLTNLMVNKNNYYGKLAPNLVGAKRAKKIANAAEKEQYNTKSNKFKEHGSGVTLNYNEIKRWDNALRHLPKNSDAFDANGGETAREMVNDLKKQIRRNSQQVPMIEPVEKLVQDVKVSDKKNKPSKLGSADVYMESKKTIYLKESHLSILKEYYNQLTFPFDDNYHMINEQRFPTKKTYEYNIDWLGGIGRYGTLNGRPNDIPKTYIRENLDECKLIKEEVFNQDTPQGFVRVLKQLYQNGTLTNSSMSNEDISNEIEYQLENNPQIGMFKDNINEFGFIDKVLSQNGKIYIERAITINSVENMLNYEGDGVGTSWSWEKGGAEAYFGNGNIQIILKGYVNPEDINWESTVFLNAYPLNDQKEIRVEVDSPIELFGFAFNGKKYKIKNPLLVNSGFTDIGIM